MNTAPLPENVPPQLVGKYPLFQGATTYENPYDTIIPNIHKDMPPIFWDPTASLGIEPAWILCRAADLTQVYLDNEHFTARGFAGFSRLIEEDWDVLPIESDIPEHTRYRMLLTPLLTPAKVAEMEASVRKYAKVYIDKIKNKNSCDFVNEFAARYPIAVFLDLFGLPMDDVEQFLAWEQDLLMRDSDLGKVSNTLRTVKKFLCDEIDKRRANPTDDLISYFVHTKIDGREPTQDEAFGLCYNLFLGGLDTVTNSLGWYFRHLATHHEHQTLLRENPQLIPQATEEFLRAYSISTTARICTKEVEIGGVRFVPGDKVILSTPLGSTDPTVHDNPTEVRFDRNARHLAFGSGVHNCVGRRLALREIYIGIEEVLKAIPTFSIAPNAKILTYLGSGPLAMETLPLVW